jgi:hypothetical protein
LREREGLEWLDRLASQRLAARQLDPGHFAARFDLRFQTVYTALLAVSVAGGALMLALLYRRQRRPFGVHLIFALHYVAFLYLAAILLGGLWNRWPAQPAVMLGATYGIVGPYLAIAMRRVYAEPLVPTVLKVLALAAFTLVLDTAVHIAALLLTLRLV